MKWIKWIFALMLTGVLLYLILGQFILPTDAPRNEKRCEEFVTDWIQVKKDGSREKVEIPGKCDVEKNEVAVIETKLPSEIKNDTYLCFRSGRQDMKLYVDNILREEYSTESTRLFGQNSAAAYIFLGLTPEDASKVLRVESQTNSAYSGIFYTIYQGTQMGIWYHFFNLYGTELIVAFLTMVLGIICIIASIALRVFYHRKVELEYLGWGIFMAAVWLITNSLFRQIIFTNISSVSDISFMVIMILPISFMIYMNAIQKRRYERIYTGLGGIVIVTFMFSAGMHMAKWKDFEQTFTYVAIVCFLCIITIVTLLIVDIFRGYIREYIFVALGVLGAICAAGVQIVMYFQKTAVFTGVVLALGLICLLVFSVINTIRDIMLMEGEKQKALSSSESKGRFLANMSHEIRTPINAVLGMDAIILRESREQHIREYALDIQNAGQSLLAIINDILDFSKIESGKMELLPVEYDFSSMIHDIVSMISMKAEVKELEVKLSLDEQLPSRLYGDDVRIRQILVNLLNNAVKYTEEGSVSFSISGKIQNDVVRLRFEVEDTGIGIREEDLVKLTKVFERIEENRNRSIEGTGLGMSIATNLLELMGSRLEVQSVYGEGTKFAFELEQKIMDEEPIGDLEERIRKQAMEYEYDVKFVAPEAKVLVVDDNGVNRRVFMNLLKETEVQIDEVGSGEECLELILEKQYDIIFLDHMMPGLDGVETLHRMKELEGNLCEGVPVIALTANAIAGAKEMYLEEGFDDYLSKPINPDKLEGMLLNYVSEEKIFYVDRKKDWTELKEVTAERFPTIEGIDWEYAMIYLKDADVLEQTVTDFYELMDGDANELETYFENIEDEEIRKQYRIKVHSMKSSSAMIGAVSLSGVARMLEYAARDGKIHIIQQVTPAFLGEWRSMKEKLFPFFGEKEETIKKVEVDYWMLQELLRMLQNAMEEMDVDTADEIVKQLKKYELPDKIQMEVDKISGAVMNLDGDQVNKQVEIISKQIQEMEDEK